MTPSCARAGSTERPYPTQEDLMTRRVRYLAIALFASLALGAAACANPVAPLDDCGGETGTCFNAGTQNSET